MSFFSQLIRFECAQDGKTYFADLGPDADGPPPLGTQLSAFRSLDDLASKNENVAVTVDRVSYRSLLRTGEKNDRGLTACTASSTTSSRRITNILRRPQLP